MGSPRAVGTVRPGYLLAVQTGQVAKSVLRLRPAFALPAGPGTSGRRARRRSTSDDPPFRASEREAAGQTRGLRPEADHPAGRIQLENSNCRMASIACGLDYDTKGAKKAPAPRCGPSPTTRPGTDSSDAKQAWSRGYGKASPSRDGQTWGKVLEDPGWPFRPHRRLAQRPVALSLGRADTATRWRSCPIGAAWLVSDHPWCRPAKWTFAAGGPAPGAPRPGAKAPGDDQGRRDADRGRKRLDAALLPGPRGRRELPGETGGATP
jgi:hypothetical protein